MNNMDDFIIRTFYIHSYGAKEQLVLFTDKGEGPRPVKMAIVDLPYLPSRMPSLGKSFYVKDPKDYTPLRQPNTSSPIILLNNEGSLRWYSVGDTLYHNCWDPKTDKKLNTIAHQRYLELIQPFEQMQRGYHPLGGILRDIHLPQEHPFLQEVPVKFMQPDGSAHVVKMNLKIDSNNNPWANLPWELNQKERASRTRALRQEVFSMGKEFYK